MNKIKSQKCQKELICQKQEIKKAIKELHNNSEVGSAKHECSQEGYEYGLEDILNKIKNL